MWFCLSRLAEKQEVQQRYVEVANHCKKLGDDITGYKRAHKVWPDGQLRDVMYALCNNVIGISKITYQWLPVLTADGYQHKIVTNIRS